MKLSELEALRRVAGHWAWAQIGGDMLDRLLEERERLLEALRQSRHYGPIVVASAAEEAIAFAEGSA